VQDSRKQAGVLVCLSAFCNVKLILSNLAGIVVVRKNRLENAAYACKVFLCDRLDHSGIFCFDFYKEMNDCWGLKI